MDIKKYHSILEQTDPANLYDLAQPALEQVEIRDLLIHGCFAKEETYRYNCVRVTFRALEQKPALFSSYWERFEEMLFNPNGYFRSIATQGIALLIAVDEERRFDGILDSYLNILDDDKIMVAGYFVQTIHLVARARPDLLETIIACLMGVEYTRHNTSRKSLLKAHIINAFDALFTDLPKQKQAEILAFVEKELESESPSARKNAKRFLAKNQNQCHP